MSTCCKAGQMDKSICFHLVLVSCFTPCLSSRPDWLFAGLQRWCGSVKEQLAGERELNKWVRRMKDILQQNPPICCRKLQKVFQSTQEKRWDVFGLVLRQFPGWPACSRQLFTAPGRSRPWLPLLRGWTEVLHSSLVYSSSTRVLLLLHWRDPTWPPEGARTAVGGQQRPTKANEGQH